MKLLCPDSMRSAIQSLVPPGDDGILISYLWPKRVSAEELAQYRLALNFHPAPLPEYRGFAPYTWGVLNGATEWGCTCHVMTPAIDDGPILCEVRWSVDPTVTTAESLRDESHTILKLLLKEVIRGRAELSKWYQKPQDPARAHYYSKLDFENARHSRAWDPEVARRAFHCPPHAGWEPL